MAKSTASAQGKQATQTPAKAATPAPQPRAAQTEGNPPRCRSCDSTDLLAVRKLTEQDYAGTGPDGKPYTAIIRRRVQCRSCSQHQVCIERPFDPKKWVGELPK